ncbi:FkbM family methyltransferase [Seongchinamella sediminis]|uniref:FkbM family methyltransferase n=1 Tax=Seongchinamella sediminis TaxID=2283635 RepID=A0A3L7DZX9_9GAMM|nr:FkbM family methyltransferase [Seongchinamella sediminis]RLQ22215.1 FkbM family methyltransferase [Seongchinamella sediminis]
MLTTIKRITYYFQVLGLNGTLLALAGFLTKRTYYLKKTVKGVAHPIELRVNSSDIPTFRQMFIYRDYDFYAKQPVRTIIDAGANIGLAAIFFANEYPDAKIIAVEPEAKNFELLLSNIKYYPQIIAIRAALWHCLEPIEIFDPGAGSWAFVTKHSDDPQALDQTSLGSVPGITVDAIIKEHDISHVDILKIDIEGAEKEVLSATEAWLPMVDTMIVELHEDINPGCTRSFYNGSNGFPHEWFQGENIYLSRTCSAKANNQRRS